MNYEGNGDSVTVATDDNNDNENYIARESSPFKSLGSEDSKSRDSHVLDKDSSRSREKDKAKGRDKDRDRDREKSRDRDRERDRHRALAIEIERRDTCDAHALAPGAALNVGQDPSIGVGLNIDHVHAHAHGPRVRTKKAMYKEEPVQRLSLVFFIFDWQLYACQVPSVPATASIPGMFPNMLAMVPGQQMGALPLLPMQAMTQQATRHARRVYVGGLPPTANEQSVATFFSQVMSAIGGNTAGLGDAVVNVYINHEKKFAFVEMRSVEEASNAMALDGIILEGVPVKVRRPTDYNPSLAAALGPSQPNPSLNLAAVGLSSGSTGGLEGPDRIFVGGLPYYFTEEQIRELLESFGPLRGFNLVKDRETGNSKGYAFCVFQDPSVTDIACAALNGIKMGDKTLTVRRAVQGVIQPKPEQEEVLLHAQQQIALQRLMLQPGSTPTKIVCLTQVVTADDLGDDEEYEDIMEDMRQEGGKFGNLVNVVIPRPNPDHDPTPGVGKVFLEYADVDGAAKARSGMNGRKFGGNQVVAVYYPENKFAQGDYEG
ncbi:hypothetical protein HID58_043125 [Brassica napus]|uniref:Splicing factor U2af large subunit n=1 Tax=Brassica napus TaxID=3708 RepID=A0ABQ8BGQ6_BRANA|nr:hypothetical protein HID58_043125 [Brassica napus]